MMYHTDSFSHQQSFMSIKTHLMILCICEPNTQEDISSITSSQEVQTEPMAGSSDAPWCSPCEIEAQLEEV